ncbi:MAG TPA: thiamine pyrophosphate-dependent dehydrogenase E1 component subunit alpha [Bdellovibrionota bacterium]|jgi:2-oxoisovalerate dehydrogenase E1 component alpha subunit|nr:thiamine pyrophosphate-dependent dehydrogenase E1 component subunit alpha [Bdellovibrionota bacterium]
MSSRKFPAQPFKDKKFCIDFFKLMVRNRVLEERLIKMAKSSDGFFWIGGPGEESTNISLGLLVNKGHGLKHDFLHLHYRSNGVLLAMGQPMLDFIRQMRCVSTDPFSGGRNFVSHVCRRDWNIVPVTSTIETQFLMAPGTARAQMKLRKQDKDSGITVVIGGDAGTAEGDFASCLIWSSRPGEELPLLMIVTNNQYGISTPAGTQHGEKHIADRAKAFGIKCERADGVSPEKAWEAISEAMEYVREKGKPYLLELMVSRLYGHSSSSGANYIDGEECPIKSFEKKLLKNEWLSKAQIEKVWNDALEEAATAVATARSESWPDPSTVLDHSFANNQKAGLPGRDF